MQSSSTNFSELFIQNIPLMDVRAPIEFQRGAFPTAENFPIMDDIERKKVGICYKQLGQERAIQKGHELVHGKLRDARIAAWVKFTKKNPSAQLYCFRGGLRSKISQQWLSDIGTNVPIINGGYKALRTFLLNELELAAKECSFTLLGGKTGSAKTILINNQHNGLDLEAAAYHRGSTFGRHATEQNNQINFENQIAIDFLKLKNKNIHKIILEDEARTIGRVGIPKLLFEKMRASSIVVIEEPFEVRLERLLQEYIVDMLVEFNDLSAEHSFAHFSNYLLTSLEKIHKRLGPVRYQAACDAMQKALSRHQKDNDLSGHYAWLKIILENYYDPMYEDQLKKRHEKIIFRGNYTECKEYLEQTFEL